MRELIDLLHGLQFSVFLCSDSSRDFNRVLAGPAYGLRRERVIGSEVQIELNGGRLVRTAVPAPLDDGPGKAVHIWERTGQRPLFAAGNAVGDIEMLTAARFALLVHHDDPDREYAYDDPHALTAAAAGGWTVTSMREDFAACGSPSPPTRRDDLQWRRATGQHGPSAARDPGRPAPWPQLLVASCLSCVPVHHRFFRLCVQTCRASNSASG